MSRSRWFIASVLSRFPRCQATAREKTRRSLCTVSLNHDGLDENEAFKKKKISRAMEAYLKRTREHQELMTKEVQDFELGRRHLANIMGKDVEALTQDDIDKAIAYLLPSGLIPEARPIMKHPEMIFQKRKAAEFDEDGRPFHFLFFTGYPNFYQVLFDAAEKLEELLSHDAFQQKLGISKPPRTISLEDSRWLTKQELSERLMEPIKDDQYAQFEAAMNYLLKLPYSYSISDFLESYRKQFTAIQTETRTVPEIQMSEDGREFAEATGCHKQARAQVKVFANGTGEWDIDGKPLEGFFAHNARLSVLFPFILLENLGQFDVTATTDWDGKPPSHDFHNSRNPYRHGETARAGAVRHGVCKCLTAFLDNDDIKKLHLSGLLTQDLRVSERSYPGHRGKKNKPRAKKHWRKR